MKLKKLSEQIDEVRPNGVLVRGMTKDDMDSVAEDFATATKFVKNCGYDGVVIHGGHGFLLHNSFLQLIIKEQMNSEEV